MDVCSLVSGGLFGSVIDAGCDGFLLDIVVVGTCVRMCLRNTGSVD